MNPNAETTTLNQPIDWELLPDVTHLLEDATDPV